MRIRVTVEAGGHGPAGDGMTPELLAVLRAAGYEGDPERNTMARAIEADLPPEVVAAMAAIAAPAERR